MTLSTLNAGQFQKLLDKAIDSKMTAVGVLLSNELKGELVQRDNLSGRNASRPGEPPAKVSGRLSGSITYRYDPSKKVLRVGTPVLYGKFLELGTTSMAARPWLRPVYRKNVKKIGKLFGGP